MLNFNHLYYFHVAATQGSLSAAATTLGIKQSTVSEQLRALETALHHRLFERTSTGMRLTAAGKIAFEHTSTMFRAGDRLVQALSTENADTPRTLRVGVSGVVTRVTSTDFLLPLFDLEDCMPTVTTGDTLDLIRQLRSNEQDLVLCENEPPEQVLDGLVHEIVDHIPLVAIGPKGCDPGPDWRDIGLVQYRPSSTLHWEVEAFLESRNLRPRILGEADDPTLLVEAAARGGHVVIVPRSAARDALGNDRVRILAQVESVHAGVHALYHDGTAAALARKAIERLIEARKIDGR